MKTISVIFTKDKVETITTQKQYTYNTYSDVKVGDFVTADTVKSNLQVTKVHDEVYTDFDFKGNLYHYGNPNSKGKIKEISCTKID